MTKISTAGEQIAQALYASGMSEQAMTDLLAQQRGEQRADFRLDSIPAWEAAYDSATFTPYLIGYCNDEEPAKAAALTWFRKHCETDDRLEWEPDPQMAVREWDQWFRLARYTAYGQPLETDIVVRHRKEAGPCPTAPACPSRSSSP